jgi:hypothetical protein
MESDRERTRFETRTVDLALEGEQRACMVSICDGEGCPMSAYAGSVGVGLPATPGSAKCGL